VIRFVYTLVRLVLSFISCSSSWRGDSNVVVVFRVLFLSVLWIVMTSPDYPQRTAFSFLSELRTQFQDRFEADVSTAKPMGFSRAARGLLKDLCAQYNVLERVDKVAQVNFQVEEVKQTMQQNIQTVIQNQENLETLVDKSDMMRNEAYVFQKSAGEAKNKMWWQNTKMLIALILVVILLVVVIPLAVHFSRKSTP